LLRYGPLSLKNMRFKILFAILPISILIAACNAVPREKSEGASELSPYAYALVLHGGAGSMNFQNVPEEMQKLFKLSLDSALQLGLDLLKEGGAV
jgi:hypothetical protein